MLRDASPHKDLPMSHQVVSALSRMLRGHVGLGALRLETLCMLVVGMVGARTVNLGHVATEAGRRAHCHLANGSEPASTGSKTC
jgi:hypothetical protein